MKTNSLTTTKTVKNKRLKTLLVKNLSGWALMLPGLILFVFFVWGPLADNILTSFYSTIGFERVDFVGVAQYVRVFEDPEFINALTNTFEYLGWSLLIGFIIPIFLGLLLSEVIHLKGFFRIAIYLPAVLSGVATAILWAYIFDPNDGGMLNTILQSLGLPTLKWTDDSDLVIPLIVLTMTWKGAGSTALIYLASMQSINSNLYEAVRIDGANAFQRIKNITLPSILPTISTLFILQVISIMQVFYEPLLIAKGSQASMTLLLLGYNYAFDSKYSGSGVGGYGFSTTGQSSAVAVILALIILGLTAVYFIVQHFVKKRYQ